MLLLLSRFSRVRLCVTPQTAAHQAPCPWDSPGKNTGVGCHFLLQCMKVKSESQVAQLCLTLRDPMECSLPGSSIHGIFQARVLEWAAIAFSETGMVDEQKAELGLLRNMCKDGEMREISAWVFMLRDKLERLKDTLSYKNEAKKQKEDLWE